MKLLADIWNHPANKQRRARGLLKSLAWQAWKQAVRRPLLTVPLHNLWLRCHPDSRKASAAIYFNSLPDFWEMRLL